MTDPYAACRIAIAHFDAACAEIPEIEQGFRDLAPNVPVDKFIEFMVNAARQDRKVPGLRDAIEEFKTPEFRRYILGRIYGAM